MWMAESLMKTKDARHSCVQFLENQNLFQVQPTENAIAVRDALCDMAIYVLEKLLWRNACLWKAKCFNNFLTRGFMTARDYHF